MASEDAREENGRRWQIGAPPNGESTRESMSIIHKQFKGRKADILKLEEGDARPARPRLKKRWTLTTTERLQILEPRRRTISDSIRSFVVLAATGAYS